jgi:TonB-linked SusC/RagA family outer membrane protein
MRFSTKHVLTTLLLAFGLAFGLDAQELNVTGTITDATDGTPLIGATLRIKDTNRGTVTDYNGEYSLKVASDATLILDYTGYASQEIPVTGQTILNLTMESSATDLGEVVVVGFGTKKKANVTGASSFVKMDKLIGDRPVVNSAQALQGIAAGLQVISSSGQPGSTGTSLNIRGTNSINGGSPLVLVNNVPMSINDVNPRDIESVTVLKDAAASSIYGARAAFGVILITTKKAGRNQPIRFNYGTTNTLSSPAELPQKATTRQFVEALSDFGVNNYFAGQEVNRWLELLDSHENDPGSLTYLQDPVSGENYPIAFDADNNTYYPLEDSDIIGDFLNDEGFSTIHNLGVSGGGENLSFRINGGYSFEDGIMVTDKDKFKKYNINAYLGADISPRLKSTTNIFYRRSDQSLAIAQYSSAIQLRGYDPTGFFETEAGEVLPFASPGNVVRYRTPSTTNVNNLRLFQSMEFSLAKNFKIIGEYTFEKRFTRTEAVNNGVIFASTFRFVPNLTAENAFAQSRLSRGNNETTYNSLNLYGKYELGLGDHNFNLLGGFNREKQVFQGVFSTRTGLIDPNLPTFNLSIGDVFDISDSYSDWAVLGLFSRLSYNFREKYFLEANLRYDGSSRFPTESRWVALPSFSAGWNVAREPWFEGMADAIPLLKFRASWGEIGNQNTSDVYPAIPGYEDYNANWVDLGTDQRYLTLSPAQLVSNSFTWEKVRTTNFGVDVGFLKGRLSTSFDVYSRETIGTKTSPI